MPKLRVESFTISLGGFGAGPCQDLNKPLGAGERLFEGVNMKALGYACTQHRATPSATHVVFTRQ